MHTNSKNLEVIFYKLLSESYPSLIKVIVIPSEFNDRIYYSIHLGIKYDDSFSGYNLEIKNKIKEIFEYTVENKNKEGVFNITYYDSTT